ncbi:helix-turn-helix domain-containing protein [Streptomyces sp. SBT349]|uniref:helix-turn-helix domain-containing protein n=1 Tax=Streptomyces sp. SBT349 TaxID=1580539 RepID=UPI00066B2F8D|nr:helix-turn-helix transcriptional regulator [Streptomyces sp. SBT349]
MVAVELPQGDMNDLEFLGREVREARGNRKLTQSQLGTGTGYTQAYVSKVEAGVLIPSEEFARKADVTLGTPGLFVRLRERVIKRSHPSWFAPFAKMEPSATEIVHFSLLLVPGIFQTERYARAIIEAASSSESEERIQQILTGRLKRQKILTQKAPPSLWVVLHESALTMQIGGPGIMREQLLYLAAPQLHNVTVQVFPFAAGALPINNPFILLHFEDRPSIAYADTSMGGQMQDEQGRVRYLTRQYDRLRAESLSPRESSMLITKIAERYPSDET